MRLLSLWFSRFRRALHAARIAADPGEHDDPGENDDARPPQSTPDPAARVLLAHDDLLWFKTSEDAEGRITLGLLECSPNSIGVLVDDNGESFGLRLFPSRGPGSAPFADHLAGLHRPDGHHLNDPRRQAPPLPCDPLLRVTDESDR